MSMRAPPPQIRVGTCTWSLCTCPIPGAVAIIQLQGDVPAALSRLRVEPVKIGDVVLRSFAGIDTGLVARWSECCAHLMPHGGTAVVRSLVAALESAGVLESPPSTPEDAYPESADEVEARMLVALSHAASPLAIDRLLNEPQRWRERRDHRHGACSPEVASALWHLLRPPLVVAIGPANVGKSTLVNSLAGRNVAIVADQPGTTRDHVGVQLDFAGLVVRYVDTPGMRDDADVIERDAQRLALEIARGADLVLLVGDANAPPIDPAKHFIGVNHAIRVALREDLTPAPWSADVRVSARTGAGLDLLVQTVRERLVPTAALEDVGAWAFWEPRSDASGD